jgi:hypothetical protein
LPGHCAAEGIAEACGIFQHPAFGLDSSQRGRRVEPAWRAVNAPHLVALVRAGATFHKGQLVERPADQEAENMVA